MKSFCTHLSGTFPLLSARVSIESGGGEAQYSTVQKAHGCSCLMVVDYLKGGDGKVTVEAVGSLSLPPGYGSL